MSKEIIQKIRELNRGTTYVIKPRQYVHFPRKGFSGVIELRTSDNLFELTECESDYETKEIMLNAAKDIICDFIRNAMEKDCVEIPDAEILSALNIKIENMITACPECNRKAVKIGVRAYKGSEDRTPGKYQMYRCTECGHSFRGEYIDQRQNIAKPLSIKNAKEA